TREPDHQQEVDAGMHQLVTRDHLRNRVAGHQAADDDAGDHQPAGKPPQPRITQRYHRQRAGRPIRSTPRGRSKRNSPSSSSTFDSTIAVTCPRPFTNSSRRGTRSSKPSSTDCTSDPATFGSSRSHDSVPSSYSSTTVKPSRTASSPLRSIAGVDATASSSGV